jgi:hypothetical protein
MLDERLKNRLKIMIEKSYYVKERYNIESTFALLYHEKPLTPAELGKFIRKSDHFLEIDEHHHFINFMYISHTDAFKASQNLIFALDKYFQNNTTNIAVDTFESIKTPTMVYNRLNDILKAIIDDPYNRVEDETIL